MKQPITLQWSNTCTTSNPTDISIQRCANVHFRHPKAKIENIVRGRNEGLDPSLDSGWYIDNDIELNNSYCYRILTHRGDEHAASIVTEFIYTYDVRSELGYIGGLPEKVYTYNIKNIPIIHIDANRTTDSLCEYNDVIINTKSLLRSNKIIENITATGELLVDNDDNQKIICKSKTPNNLNNSTTDTKKTHLNYCVSENISCDVFTVFAVVYCGYTTDEQNEYEIVPGVFTRWTDKQIVFSLPSGTRTISRVNEDKYKILCVRVTSDQTHCWENSKRCYMKKHTKNKNKCTWSNKKQYDILPNNRKQTASGLCEYIVFDSALDAKNMSIVDQYLSKKYNTTSNNIDITDL